MSLETGGLKPLLEFRDAAVFRGERVVLDGLTLAIGLGEHTVVSRVGPLLARQRNC